MGDIEQRDQEKEYLEAAADAEREAFAKAWEESTVRDLFAREN